MFLLYISGKLDFSLMYKPRKITFLSQVTSDITCQASFFEKLYGELIPLVVKWYTPPSRKYNPLNLF